MARPGDINADIGIALNEQGMSGSLKALQAQIGGIIKELNTAAAAAQQAIKAGGDAGAAAAKTVAQQVNAIGKLQGSVKTLQNVNSNNIFGGFKDSNAIGKTMASFDQFMRGLEKGAPTVDKLTSRLTLMNQQAAQISQGKTLPTNFWEKRLQVEGAIAAHKKLQQSYERTVARVNALSPEGRNKAAPFLGQLDAARTRFDSLAGDNRSNAALGTNLAQQKILTEELNNQLKLIEKQDKDYQGLLRTTQLRAAALLNMSSTERESQLRNGANRFGVLLNGRVGGGQFNDTLGGSGVPNFRTTGQQAFERATAAAARAQVQLNNALSSDAGAKRVQQLIDRYENLQRLQQQSLALTQQENKIGFVGGIKQGFQSVARGPGGMGEGGLGGAGNLIGRVAAFTAAYQGIQLVTGALQGAITFAIEFEDKLAQLQAISGATSIEMQRLSQNILDVSKNSANSVVEITEAAKILAQAGYTASETGQLLTNIVNLSAASGATPAESVDILTSALGAFRLQASDSTQVADALVAVLNESKLSVNQVQLGLQYLGATAKDNNINFETLISTLGAAADAGIRSGSTMATGTRQLLIDLQEPSKKLVSELSRIGLTMGDVDVKTKGLLPVLRTLKEQGFEAFGTVETRAAAMYEVLANNTDNIERLRETTLRNNTAQEAAAKRMSSLSAQWQAAKNDAAELGASIGKQLIPLAKELISVFRFVIDILNRFDTAGNAARDTINRWSDSIRGFLGLSSGMADSTDYWTRKLKENSTALNDAKAATSTQKDSISSLDNEMESIINRYDALKTRNADTTYEVNRLSERFPGLREEFNKTKGGIDGLITSLLNLRGEMLETLRQKAEFELTAGIRQEQTLKSTGIAQAKALRDKYRPGREIVAEGPATRDMIKLFDRQNQIVMKLTSTDGNARSAGEKDFRAFFLDEGVDKAVRDKFYKAVQDFLSTRMDYWAQQANNTANRDFIARSAYAVTPTGQRLANATSASGASSDAAVSNAEGKPLGQRRQILTVELNKAEANLADIMLNLELMKKKGDKLAIETLEALANQQRITIRNIKSVGNKTEDEIKDENARPRGPGAGRGMSSAQMKAALEQQFPGIQISSGYRGPDHRLYDPGSWHSKVPGGRAVDIAKLPSGTSIDNVIAFIESLGQQIDKNNPNSFLDEFKNPSRRATGGHFHLGFQPKQSNVATQEESETQRQLNLQLEQNVKLAQAELSAKKRVYDASLQSLADAKTTAEIVERTAAVDANFIEVAKAEKKLADAQSKKTKMSVVEAQELLDSARERMDADLKEKIRKTADIIIAIMDKFIKDREKIIANEFDRAMNASRTNLARQEGLLEGMNNRENVGLIPEYTKVIQQNRTYQARAQERRDLMAANNQRIESTRGTINQLSQDYSAVAKGRDPAAMGAVYTDYKAKVDAANLSIQALQVTQANLIAQSDALAQAPKTWGEAMTQAVQGWQITNNYGISLSQRMFQGLGDTLNRVHGAFSQFFMDIVSGTKSVGQAFGDMAKAVIKAMVEMAIKAVATQIFGLLLSFIPSASGRLINSSIANYTGPVSWAHKGGLIEGAGREPKRFAQGGMVKAGIPTRDTVPALLSKGEFVMRRTSVEDIGHRLLNDMNNRGGQALDKLGGNNIIAPQAPPVNTSVYVVLPEERPSLGANDVLAVVHRDVLRNGATKALIKQVAAGG